MPSNYILVVDDEKEVTMILKGLFASLGHQMLTALDGAEALRIIEERDPALVLLDVRMPGIDGIQILKKLKKEKPQTKVIIMTTFVKENQEEVERIGIDGFFSKPIDLNGLVERIRFVLESRQDTRFFPSQNVKEAVSTATPKAKLLFIEPNPIVYGFTCAMFNAKELIKGDYEIRVTYGADEGMRALYQYQPDIVIMYDSIYHMNDVKKLADIIMSQSHRPKTVILHGLVPKMDHEIRELENMGIKFCNQNPMNDEVLKNFNRTLVDFVDQECVRRGLVR